MSETRMYEHVNKLQEEDYRAVLFRRLKTIILGSFEETFVTVSWDLILMNFFILKNNYTLFTAVDCNLKFVNSYIQYKCITII